MTVAFRKATEYVGLKPPGARIQQNSIGWLQSETVSVNAQQ